jgi:hypothetical protein
MAQRSDRLVRLPGNPYATGGGGYLLEHAYGGSALAALLTGVAALTHLGVSPGPGEPEETWRWLHALRIIELRLEGDDAADRTDLILQRHLACLRW